MALKDLTSQTLKFPVLENILKIWYGYFIAVRFFLTYYFLFEQALQINEYGAFLHNYGRATDAVRKCSQSSTQFAQIMHSIPVRTEKGKMNEQKASLEDLLHKPVARIQKNALVLNDLIKYTPELHTDHQTLAEALAMNQSFLDEFNMIQTKSMFPVSDSDFYLYLTKFFYI